MAVGRRLELHPGSDPEFPLIRRSRHLAAIPTSISKLTEGVGRNYEQVFVDPVESVGFADVLWSYARRDLGFAFVRDLLSRF